MEEDGQENLCVEGSVTCIGTSIVVFIPRNIIPFNFYDYIKTCRDTLTRCIVHG